MRSATRLLPLTLVALAGLVATTSCTGDPTGRDLDDTTAPILSLTVTAAAGAPGGVLDVAFGQSVTLNPPGGSVLVKAADPSGVRFVEIWLSIKETCNGVDRGPTLPGAPARRVDGTVTATAAPGTITAAYDINALPQRTGCTYRFEVSGRAANAATTPVEASTPAATLTMHT